MRYKMFLIIKQNSERVKRKNFRLLDNRPLHQFYMEQRKAFDIYIDTDSDEIIEFYSTERWPFVYPYKRLQEHIKIESSGNASPAPLMIERFINNYAMSDNFIITSHVTSPFISDESILKACEYMESFDSVSSVDSIQEFAVDRIGAGAKPINFNLDKIVKTQSLKPIGVLNGAFFILKPHLFKENGLRRISSSHYYYPLSKIEALDIDTEFDLNLSQALSGRVV
jgi:CMP-N-acetylneuraminic acid synthetase